MENLSEMTFTTEYRLLESYHSRRKSKSRARPLIIDQYQCDSGPTPPSNTRTGPRAVQHSGRTLASLDTGEFADVAEKLTYIVESAPSASEEVVPDDGDLIQRIVELLKESGDKLNEEILRDHNLASFFQKSFSYSMFENLASAFVRAVVPESRQAEGASQKKVQIAWTFEMTSRLGALDLQPMNRCMGFGAQYLHQNFAPWIQQQGGWEKVFNNDGDNEEVQ